MKLSIYPLETHMKISSTKKYHHQQLPQSEQVKLPVFVVRIHFFQSVAK